MRRTAIACLVLVLATGVLNVSSRVSADSTPLSLNQHPRLGMTLADRAAIKTRVSWGGEWNTDFQNYVNYLTNSAQWNSPATNSQMLSLWAAAAGFVYQMRVGGDPSGVNFNGMSQADFGAKGVEWLERAMADYPANDERNRPMFFAYDWLHDVIGSTDRTAFIQAWERGVTSSAAVIKAEAAYPAYSGFNWFDSQYAGYYGDWVMAGLAARGDGIEETWLQTGIDRHDWAFRGLQGIVTKETERSGTDGGFMQMLAYGLGFVMGRVSPVEMAYRTALNVNPTTFYDPAAAGWLRGFVPYVVRGILPWGKANGGPDGHEWLINREPTSARSSITYGSYSFWWVGLARKELVGIDENTAELAVWFSNHRTYEPIQPETWTFSRFLGRSRPEGSPASLGMAPDKAHREGKWQWRTGWTSITDALVNVYAFQFGRSPAGSFTIDYNGPALPMGSGANHDWDSTTFGGFHSTMGFPEQGRSTLETSKAEYDDYGYPRTYYVDADAKTLTPGTSAEYVPPSGTKFRATSDGPEGVGYLYLDLSRAYNGDAVLDGLGNAPKVASYARKFIYFPPSQPGVDSLRVFLFDSATVKAHSPAFEKRQTFVLPFEPTIDGTPHANEPVRNGSGDRKTRYSGASVVSFALNGANYTAGAGNKTFISPLAPTGFDIVKVGYRFLDSAGHPRLEDAYGRYNQQGTDGEWSNIQTYDEYMGWYRVEIVPTTTQLTDHFCTAIEVAPSAGGSQSATESVGGVNFVGGRIGDAIGVHSTSDNGGGGTIVIRSPGRYRVMIAGLTPSGIQNVAAGSSISLTQSTGASCAVGCTASAQGTLFLNAVVSAAGTGGSNTISIGQTTGVAATAPAPPSGVQVR